MVTETRSDGNAPFHPRYATTGYYARAAATGDRAAAIGRAAGRRAFHCAALAVARLRIAGLRAPNNSHVELGNMHNEGRKARIPDIDQRDAAPGAGTRGSGRCAPAGAEGGAATPAALRRRLNGAVPEARARRRVRVRHGRRGRYRVTASSSSRRSAEAPTRTDPSPRRSPVQGIHVLATSITQMEIRRASSGVSVPRKRSSSSVALRGRTPDSGSWQYCSPNQNTR